MPGRNAPAEPDPLDAIRELDELGLLTPENVVVDFDYDPVRLGVLAQAAEAGKKAAQASVTKAENALKTEAKRQAAQRQRDAWEKAAPLREEARQRSAVAARAAYEAAEELERIEVAIYEAEVAAGRPLPVGAALYRRRDKAEKDLQVLRDQWREIRPHEIGLTSGRAKTSPRPIPEHLLTDLDAAERWVMVIREARVLAKQRQLAAKARRLTRAFEDELPGSEMGAEAEVEEVPPRGADVAAEGQGG